MLSKYNPYSTLTQLADALGVKPLNLYRINNGTYTHFPYAMALTLSSLSGYPTADIENAYQKFRESKFKAIAEFILDLKESPYTLQSLDIDGYKAFDIIPDTLLSEPNALEFFLQREEDIPQLYGSWKELRNSTNLSQAAFCNAICFHQAILSKFEDHRMKNFPVGLRENLKKIHFNIYKDIKLSEKWVSAIMNLPVG